MKYEYENDETYERRANLRAEYARERSHSYRYHCGERTCGASDCGSCRNGTPPWEEEDEEDRTAARSRLVIARKARGNILPGDCVRITSGYTYIQNGPRTGYFRREEIVGFGAGHRGDPVFGCLVGQGTWPVNTEVTS